MASRRFGTPIDLQKNELQNAKIQNLAADPSAPVAGQIYYNTVSLKKRTYNGTTWDEDVYAVNYVSQAANSGSSGRLKVSGGTDRTIVDYSSGAGILKSDVNGVISAATAGTDYVTAGSTNTFTNKTFDAAGTGNTLSNISTSMFAVGVFVTSVTSGSTNSQVPSALGVYNAIQAGFAANDALVFRGSIDASTNPNYPAANAGDVYKISVAGRIGGASGALVTVGDTLYATVDGSAAGTQAAVGANWTIVQNNVDAATTSTQGLVVLATLTEAEAKTDTAKAVVPADLLNFAIKRTFTIGDGTATSFALTHSLGSTDIIFQARDATTGEPIEPGVTSSTTTVLTLTFVPAPTLNSVKVVVIG